MEELSSGGPNKRQRVAQPASNATNGRQAVPAPPTVEGSPPLLRSMECTRLTKVLSSVRCYFSVCERERLLTELLQSSPPTSVLIAGGSGSGKTTLVRNAIKSENDCVVAWINCEFIMSKKDLYRSIIFHLLRYGCVGTVVLDLLSCFHTTQCPATAERKICAAEY